MLQFILVILGAVALSIGVNLLFVLIALPISRIRDRDYFTAIRKYLFEGKTDEEDDEEEDDEEGEDE